MRVLTWHVHGSYLRYLAEVPHEIVVPAKPGRPEGYGGRAGHDRWPDNLVEVPAEAVPDLDVDAIVFQSHRNWLVDQHELLSDAQRRLPRIYLEHDPPRQSPTDTRHPVDDPDVLVVHVTAFNALMWDNGDVPTRVIDHGVVVPDDVRYTGELARGLVVTNGLATRGRRLGADLVERARARVPLDIVGMGSEQVGGLGEVPAADLPALMARYRFLFHPVRWTSLGLAVCEAMSVGLPVVGLACTELVTVVDDGESGIIDTDPDRLEREMAALIADPERAQRLGAGARRTARQRFGIERFTRDWDRALRDVVARPVAPVA